MRSDCRASIHSRLTANTPNKRKPGRRKLAGLSCVWNPGPKASSHSEPYEAPSQIASQWPSKPLVSPCPWLVHRRAPCKGSQGQQGGLTLAIGERSRCASTGQGGCVPFEMPGKSYEGTVHNGTQWNRAKPPRIERNGTVQNGTSRNGMEQGGTWQAERACAGSTWVRPRPPVGNKTKDKPLSLKNILFHRPYLMGCSAISF